MVKRLIRNFPELLTQVIISIKKAFHTCCALEEYLLTC